MKKLFALTLSLLMFSAFASVQFDSGGVDNDVIKQKTEISTNQIIPVVADIYIADSNEQVATIPVSDHFFVVTESEQLSNNNTTNISTNNYFAVYHFPVKPKGSSDYRRTDHDFRSQYLK